MVQLDIFVKLSARRQEIWMNSILQKIVVVVSAKPVDGKANDAVVRLLAKKLGLGPTKVTIISGHTSRQKRIGIETDLPETQVVQILSS